MSMKCENLLKSSGCPEVKDIRVGCGCVPVTVDLSSLHQLNIPDYCKPPKKSFDWFKVAIVLLILIDIGVNVYSCFWRK